MNSGIIARSFDEVNFKNNSPAVELL